MDLNSTIRETAERMDKSVKFFQDELRGIRTGRATPALVEQVKADYYGSPTPLRELAQINVPDSTTIMIKPFDPGAKGAISKAIESADLGFNPQVEGDSLRVNVPSPSKERRQQLVAQVKKMAEDSRVAIRNERRDGMKDIDKAEKDKSNDVSEDQAKDAKDEIDAMTKKHTAAIDEHCDKKCKEIEEG